MATNGVGLDKHALSFWDLVFQSISHISPIGAMIANMTAIAAYAGKLMPMTFVLAAIAFGFLLIILIQFSRQVVSAGGFYGYVTAGLGTRWGGRTGWLMLLTYWMVVNFSLIFIAGVLIPQTIGYLFGVSVPSWLWVPLVVVVGAIVWGMAYRGIKLSIRFSLVAMAVGIVVMAAAAIGIIVHAGSNNNPALFFDVRALHGAALNGLGVGIIFAMLSLGGASSAIYLSEETPTPQKTVTRAVIWAFVICLILFLLSSYALTVGWGPSHMGTFAKANIPGVELTRRAMGSLLAGALVFFAFVASYTGTLAPANALVRIVYAMARDGQLLPKRLDYIHPTYRTPTRAILAVGVVGVAIAIVFGLILGPFTAFAILAITSTVAHFVSHILVNVSLPVFGWRQKHLNFVNHIVPATMATGLVLVAFYLIMFPVHFPVELGPIIVAVWWLVGEWRMRSLSSGRFPKEPAQPLGLGR